MSRVPVKRRKNEDPSVFWRGHPVTLDDFNEIREYVDSCLKPSSTPEGMTLKLTNNYHLLRYLVRALDAEIPWGTPDEISKALQSIPERPQKPQPPKGSTRTMTARHHLRQKTLQYEIDLGTYRKAIANFEESLPDWQHRHQLYLELKERCKPYLARKKIIKRLLEELDRVIARGGLVFEELSWQILPPGASLSSSIQRYLTAARARFPSRRFDSTRLQQVMSLKPSHAYVGHGEFDGYVVFLFNRTPYAVLECPWVGNALYLLKGNWTALSKLPKSTLLGSHHRDVERIIHDERGMWFRRLANRLGRRSSNH